jgi:hypothetical protein
LVLVAGHDPAARGGDTLRVISGLAETIGAVGAGDPQAEVLAFIDECLPGLASKARRNLLRVAIPFFARLHPATTA